MSLLSQELLFRKELMKGKIKYFGTDGIRQKAEAFTPGFIQAITLGIVRYLGNARETVNGMERPVKVLLGGDTRESTEWILRYFEEALETVGIDHGNVGVLPTPAINYAFYQMGYDLAIDITASHNPASDNGIKIFERGDSIGGIEAVMPGGVGFKGTGTTSSGQDLSSHLQSYPYGIKLSQAGTYAIENALENETGFDVGAVEFAEDLHEDAKTLYLQHLKQYIENIGPSVLPQKARKHPDFSNLKIGLDCANGATSVTARAAFESFGAKVEVIHDDASYGEKINLNCGSTHLESLIQLVKDKNLDFGAAFDGDGDRCLMVDQDSSLIDGDDMIACIASYLGLPKVAVTIMANKGLLNWSKATGIDLVMTDVGDQNVSAKMRKEGILLGGEQSGHIILPGESMGDGVLTALVMTKIYSEALAKKLTEDQLITSYDQIQQSKQATTISDSNQRESITQAPAPQDPKSAKPQNEPAVSLSSICSMLKKLPQVIKNQPVSSSLKQAFRSHSQVAEDFITQKTQELEPLGWSLNIRASGTEELVRITIWGDNEAAILDKATEIATALLSLEEQLNLLES